MCKYVGQSAGMWKNLSTIYITFGVHKDISALGDVDKVYDLDGLRE